MYLWGPQPEALVSSLRQRWSPEEALAAAGTVAARALLDFHYRVVLRGAWAEAEVLDPTTGLDSQVSCLVERSRDSGDGPVVGRGRSRGFWDSVKSKGHSSNLTVSRHCVPTT